MSVRYIIKSQENVELSADGKEIEILYDTDYNGNCYVDVPVEYIRKVLEENK